MVEIVTVVLTMAVLYGLAIFVHSMLDAGHWWIVPIFLAYGFGWAWLKDRKNARIRRDAERLIASRDDASRWDG